MREILLQIFTFTSFSLQFVVVFFPRYLKINVRYPSLRLVAIVPLLYSLLCILYPVYSFLSTYTHGGFLPADYQELSLFSSYINLYWIAISLGWFLSEYVCYAFLRYSPPPPVEFSSYSIKPHSPPPPVEFSSYSIKPQISGVRQVIVLIICALVPILILNAYNDPNELFFTHQIGRFSSGRDKSLMSLVDVLLWLLPSLAALLTSYLAAYSALFFLVISSIATGERHASLSILIFLIVRTFFYRHSKKFESFFTFKGIVRRGLFLGTILFVIILSALILQNRAEGRVGLMAFLGSIPSNSIADYVTQFYRAIAYYIAFTVQVNLEYLATGATDFIDIIYSFRLPQFLTGISQRLDFSDYNEFNRIRSRIPAPGFSMLILFFKAYSFIFISAVSFFCSFIWQFMASFLSGTKLLFFRTLVIAAALIPLLLSFQYQLRTCATMFYLCFALLAGIYLSNFWPRFKRWLRGD